MIDSIKLRSSLTVPLEQSERLNLQEKNTDINNQHQRLKHDGRNTQISLGDEDSCIVSCQLKRAFCQRSQHLRQILSKNVALSQCSWNARSITSDRTAYEMLRNNYKSGEQIASLSSASSHNQYYGDEKQKNRILEFLSFEKRVPSPEKTLESVRSYPQIVPAVHKNISDRKDESSLTNEMLESAVKTSLQSAIDKVHSATEAKNKTKSAIIEHTKILKRTIDDGQDGDWSKVAAALETVNALTIDDSKAETNARNYLDNVYQVVKQGKSNEQTKNNLILSSADHTLNKLVKQLDEMNAEIRETQSEGKIINQYKDLIDKSRKEFAQELKSILPNIDLHAQESKLSEEELNALIAHAHLKIDQLRKQLIEQKVREQQHVAAIIEEQMKSYKEISGQELKLKIDEMSANRETEIEKLVNMKRQLWETELEDKLQRTTSAHSEHMEEVVRAQRSLFDIELKQRIADAITEERALYSKRISNALGRLEAIEATLKFRYTQDLENRRSKQLWIACQNLVGSVIHGRKGATDMEARRKPLATELQIIREACSNDEFVGSVINSLSDEIIYKGIYTEEDLRMRFNKLYGACRKIAKMDENKIGVLHYLLSYLQHLVSFDMVDKYAKSDKFDPNSLDSYEILGRAKYFANEGDFASAVRMLNLLARPIRNIARDWIHDAVAHLEARFVAELLVIHAAVSNFSSMY